MDGDSDSEASERSSLLRRSRRPGRASPALGLLGSSSLGGESRGGDGGSDPFPFMTGGRFHACSSCRRDKSKCDGDYPCGRCVRHCLTCLPQQYDTSHPGPAPGGRRKPGRRPKRKGGPAAAAATAAAAAAAGIVGADGEASEAGTGVVEEAPPGPPPVIEMTFRRAEPEGLRAGLVAAVKALAAEGEVDRALALRWLRSWRRLSRYVGADVTLGAADGIMGLLRISRAEVEAEEEEEEDGEEGAGASSGSSATGNGGATGKEGAKEMGGNGEALVSRAASPRSPITAAGAGAEEDGQEGGEGESRGSAAGSPITTAGAEGGGGGESEEQGAAERAAVAAGVLLPLGELVGAPTFRIFETQRTAAVVLRMDRNGRVAAAATRAHARALRSTGELLEDVLGRRALQVFSMATAVATDDRPAWFKGWATLLFSASCQTFTQLVKAINREGRVALFLLRGHRRPQEDADDEETAEAEEAGGLDLWMEVEPAPVSRYTTEEAEGGGRSIVRRFRRTRPWEEGDGLNVSEAVLVGVGGVGGGESKQGSPGSIQIVQQAQQQIVLIRPVGALPVPPLGEHEKSALLAVVAAAGTGGPAGHGASQAEAIFPRMTIAMCVAKTSSVPAFPGPERMTDQERVERKRERRRLYMAWRRAQDRKAKAAGLAARREAAAKEAAAAVMASGFRAMAAQQGPAGGNGKNGNGEGGGGLPPAVPKKKRKNDPAAPSRSPSPQQQLLLQQEQQEQHMQALAAITYGLPSPGSFAMMPGAFGLPPAGAFNPFMVYVQGQGQEPASQQQQQQQAAMHHAAAWGAGAAAAPYSPNMAWGGANPAALSAVAMAAWAPAPAQQGAAVGGGEEDGGHN